MEEQIFNVDVRESTISTRVCNMYKYLPSFCTPLITRTTVVALSHSVCARVTITRCTGKTYFSQWILQTIDHRLQQRFSWYLLGLSTFKLAKHYWHLMHMFNFSSHDSFRSYKGFIQPDFCFTRSGITDIHKEHVWSDDNSQCDSISESATTAFH